MAHDESVKPSFGLFLNAFFPKHLAHCSSYNELLFTTFKVTSTGTTGYGVYGNSTYTARLGFSYLKLVNMFRFRIPVEKEFIYFNAGITQGIIVAQDNYLDLSGNYGKTEALPDVRHYEFGLTGGLGFTFYRFSIDARYERSNGVSVYNSLKSPVHRFYLFLGLRF